MMTIDSRLLDTLVCPICKGPLKTSRGGEAEAALPEGVEAELVCPADRLAFPIKDGIARMLVDEARSLA